MTTVWFRADADDHIGHGHYARTHALARALVPSVPCRFATQTMPYGLVESIRTDGIEVDYLDAGIAIPDVARGDVLVVDLGEGNARAANDANGRGALVVAITDRPTDSRDFALIVSPGGHLTADDFADRATTQLLLGPAYALIDPAWYRASPQDRDPERVIVSFGGSDVGGFLDEVVTALEDLGVDLEVVAGGGTPPRPRGRVSSRSHLNREAFRALAFECDLAVAGGGGTALELSAAGIPSVLVAIAPDQRRVVEHFADAELALRAPENPARIRRELQRLRTDPGLRAAIRANCRRAFGRPGVEAVAARIKALVGSFPAERR